METNFKFKLGDGDNFANISLETKMLFRTLATPGTYLAAIVKSMAIFMEILVTNFSYLLKSLETDYFLISFLNKLETDFHKKSVFGD